LEELKRYAESLNESALTESKSTFRFFMTRPRSSFGYISHMVSDKAQVQYQGAAVTLNFLVLGWILRNIYPNIITQHYMSLQ
jgi:hypothetical protein